MRRSVKTTIEEKLIDFIVNYFDHPFYLFKKFCKNGFEKVMLWPVRFLPSEKIIFQLARNACKKVSLMGGSYRGIMENYRDIDKSRKIIEIALDRIKTETMLEKLIIMIPCGHFSTMVLLGAIKRITDQESLIRICAEAERSEFAEFIVRNRLDEAHHLYHVMHHCTNPSAVNRIKSQDTLEEVATNCFSEEVASAAIERLNNQKVVHGIALTDCDEHLRKLKNRICQERIETAVCVTQDRRVLKQVTEQSPFQHVRLLAARRLGLVTSDMSKAVELLQLLKEGCHQDYGVKILLASKGRSPQNHLPLDVIPSLIDAAILITCRGIDHWFVRGSEMEFVVDPTCITFDAVTLVDGEYWMRLTNSRYFKDWLQKASPLSPDHRGKILAW